MPSGRRVMDHENLGGREGERERRCPYMQGGIKSKKRKEFERKEIKEVLLDARNKHRRERRGRKARRNLRMQLTRIAIQ